MIPPYAASLKTFYPFLCPNIQTRESENASQCPCLHNEIGWGLGRKAFGESVAPLVDGAPARQCSIGSSKIEDKYDKPLGFAMLVSSTHMALPGVNAVAAIRRYPRSQPGLFHEQCAGLVHSSPRLPRHRGFHEEVQRHGPLPCCQPT